MVNCSNCGVDAGDNNFCPNCGTKIIVEEYSSICPNCGVDAGDSNFCPNCGTKIVEEDFKTLCPSCGEDVGDSIFCPKCGTKMGEEMLEKTCPSCGKTLNENANFCPYCGWSESQNYPESSVDKIINAEEVVAGKFGETLGKSRIMDSIIDKSLSIRKKYGNADNSTANRKYYEKIEPVFLEVYDSIDDDYLKSILLVVRQKHDNQGGGLVGIVATKVNTPTTGMSHDDAVQYYVDMANSLQNEINQEKQNGTFDEDEFYKRKIKESTFGNMSSISGLKYFKK